MGKNYSLLTLTDKVEKSLLKMDITGFAAYMELGIEPNMIIRNTGGPVGFPNWSSITFQTP